jgi:hypothetical protein
LLIVLMINCFPLSSLASSSDCRVFSMATTATNGATSAVNGIIDLRPLDYPALVRSCRVYRLPKLRCQASWIAPTIWKPLVPARNNTRFLPSEVESLWALSILENHYSNGHDNNIPPLYHYSQLRTLLAICLSGDFFMLCASLHELGILQHAYVLYPQVTSKNSSKPRAWPTLRTQE